MEIVIFSPGKANEAFIQPGIDYYFKKIKHFHPIGLQILTNNHKSTASPQTIKAQEEELILKKISPGDFVILLDEHGKKLDNEQWAQGFQSAFNQAFKRIVFIIGGAYGVSTAVKQKANVVWSLSDLVFPHQLVRLLLAEQIYRTFTLLHHLPYHNS